MKLLGSRSDLVMHAVSSWDELDFAALARLNDAAWRADYRGAIRFVYDEQYLRWLLGGSDWFGVIIQNGQSQPVGTMFSLFRQLRWGNGMAIRGHHTTGLTVAPDYRRLGLGSWIHDELVEQIYGEYNSRIGLAVYHAGHAGQRLIDTYMKSEKKVRGVFFNEGMIWGRRLTPTQSHGPTLSSARTTQVWLDDNGVLQSGASSIKVSREDLDEMLGASSLNWAPAESFSRLYLTEASHHGTTLWVEFDSGARCCVIFSCVKTAIDTYDVGLIGQIQVVAFAGCSESELVTALQSACSVMQARKYVAASIVDHGNVPQQVIAAAGFTVSQDRLVFALRAHEDEFTERACKVAPPFHLDYL